MVLSERLQFIYENLLHGQALWDFCCDHGYLGIEALKSQRFTEVCFVDRVPHIVANVETLVLEKFPKLHAQAQFIATRGEEVSVPVHGNIVIAGVGAFVICRILEGLMSQQLLHAQRVLLCPQRDEEKFLAMLQAKAGSFSNEFFLTFEKTLSERARARTIFIFDRA